MRRPIRLGSGHFRERYRSRYGQDPVRTATLAYDAVSLVAALVKTQGPARFAEETLTNNSGFAGIDGVFRFRPDGTNQRGLAVMRVTPCGPGRQPGAEAPNLRRLFAARRDPAMRDTAPPPHVLSGRLEALIDQLGELVFCVVFHCRFPSFLPSFGYTKALQRQRARGT